jgi:hypothetical protein
MPIAFTLCIGNEGSSLVMFNVCEAVPVAAGANLIAALVI